MVPIDKITQKFIQLEEYDILKNIAHPKTTLILLELLKRKGFPGCQADESNGHTG